MYGQHSPLCCGKMAPETFTRTTVIHKNYKLSNPLHFFLKKHLFAIVPAVCPLLAVTPSAATLRKYLSVLVERDCVFESELAAHLSVSVLSIAFGVYVYI